MYGELKIITVEGKALGTSLLDAGVGSSVWVTLQVQVKGQDGKAGQASATLPSIELMSGLRLASISSTPVELFVQAFTAAMAKQLSVDDLHRLELKLAADIPGFRVGYAKGCIFGLIKGLTNLIEAIVDIAKLAVILSPIASVIRMSVGAYRFMTDDDYRNAILSIPDQVSEVANSIESLIRDIIQHPDDYLIMSTEVGTRLGEHAGDWIKNDFLGQSAEQIGEDLGNVAGQVLFEVILQLLLAAATAGAGNAARAGTSAAEVAKAGATLTKGSRVTRIVSELRNTVMRRPGFQRLLKAMEALYADQRGATALGGAGNKVLKGTGNVGRIISESRVGGRVVIRSEVGISPGVRLGTENVLPRGVEVGRPGWQRAHSTGQITGAESGAGIRFAPEELNQEFQRLGIEQFISDLNTQKAANVKLFMTTETETHSGTLALKSITYRLEAAKAGARPIIVYEAEITCTRDVLSPRITASANQVRDIEEFLIPLAHDK